MINIGEVIETNDMVEKENLDVRTITLGISLLDCIDSDLAKVNENIYNKITTLAKNLVVNRKRDREQLLYPYCKQTYFSYTYRPCRRCGLQELRGFCYHSKDT